MKQQSLFFHSVLWAFAVFSLVLSATANPISPEPKNRFFVGMGAGSEAGNGLQLGFKHGAYAAALGLGLLFEGETDELRYSAGLRGLRTLYAGRVNDTYAWTGAGISGQYWDYNTDRYRYLISVGAGLGVSLHFGLPFHLNFDSGWRAYYNDSSDEEDYQEMQFGPTLNGTLVYEW